MWRQAAKRSRDFENILVTGGLGYIGSHVSVELADNGYRPIILDDCSNSHENVKVALDELSGGSIFFVDGSVLDKSDLGNLFDSFDIKGVVHLAAKKSVPESINKPAEYFETNFMGSLALVKAMQRNNCRNLVFSSSAAVYSEFKDQALKEPDVTLPQTPYGLSKYFVELMLEKVALSETSWSVSNMRYFNPLGCHDSLKIGDRPHGPAANVMPKIIQAAMGTIEYLSIFGGDYDSVDGTAVRDYIHVTDLAAAHVLALKDPENGTKTLNISTGVGTTVLQLIKTFERANNVEVPHKIEPRRAGDAGIVFGDNQRVSDCLNWAPRKNIEDMCRNSWDFALKHESRKQTVRDES